MTKVTMGQEMEGLRVRLTIEEDGTTNPPTLPHAIISRKITGTDGLNYYLVRLDQMIRSTRWDTGKEWTLNELAVINHFRDFPVEELLGKTVASVPVRILNVQGTVENDAPVLDLEKAVYFARGMISLA